MLATHRELVHKEVRTVLGSPQSVRGGGMHVQYGIVASGAGRPEHCNA